MSRETFFSDTCICVLTLLYFLSTSSGQYWSTYYYPEWFKEQHHDEEKCPTPNGQFNHPRHCDLFLNCWEGQAVIGRCQHGLVFNERIRACDYSKNVNCTGKTNSHDSFPPTDPRCPKHFGTFVNPENCSEYFVCQSGMATVYQCPKGTYYNRGLGVCDYSIGEHCSGTTQVSPKPQKPIHIDSTSGSVTENPDPAVEKPGQVVGKPDPGVEKPGQVVEKPGQVVEKPGPAVEKPGPAAQKPGQAVEKPSPVMEKPDPVVEKPGPPVEKPGPAVEKPGPAAQKPGQVVEKPSPVVEKPGPPVEKPGSVVQKPGKPVEKPGQVVENPEEVNEIEHPGPTPPVPAGTPTIPPTTSQPQSPFRPKPPLVTESTPSPTPIPDQSSPQSQKPNMTSSPPIVISNLKPKPPLKPDNEEEASPAPSIDVSNIKPKPPFLPPSSKPNPSEPQTPKPPLLNPGSFKPQKPPSGPPFGGTSTTPEPIDGEDDPHILFPFLPKFPDLFKCPIPTTILPVIGDCKSIIACISGISHQLRCPDGENYDMFKGRCSPESTFLCKKLSNSESDIEMNISNESVKYAYLPVSMFNQLLNSEIQRLRSLEMPWAHR